MRSLDFENGVEMKSTRLKLKNAKMEVADWTDSLPRAGSACGKCNINDFILWYHVCV
jgi:hypothetical protein